MPVAQRHRFPAAFAGGLACLAALPATAAGDPSGTYFTENGKARIRVEKCGADRQSMCGFVVWMRDLNKPGAPQTDAKNPDAAKQARPLLGHQLMLGLKPADEGQYKGKIYNAEDGKSYDVTVWTEAAGGDLKVKGCLLFLCQTQNWKRVSDVQPGQLTAATGAGGGPVPDPEWAAGRASAGAPKAKPKS